MGAEKKPPPALACRVTKCSEGVIIEGGSCSCLRVACVDEVSGDTAFDDEADSPPSLDASLSELSLAMRSVLVHALMNLAGSLSSAPSRLGDESSLCWHDNDKLAHAAAREIPIPPASHVVKSTPPCSVDAASISIDTADGATARVWRRGS